MDPFSLLYDNLLQMVYAAPGIKSIPSGNVLDYNNNEKRSTKPNVGAADIPQVLLLSKGGSPQVRNTSTTTAYNRQYIFKLTAEDKTLAESLYPLEFGLLTSLAAWQSTITSLTWPESDPKSFVKSLRVVDSDEGLDLDNLSEGQVAWATVWTLEIGLIFKTKDLIDYYNGVIT